MSDRFLRASGYSRPLAEYETAVLRLPAGGSDNRRTIELVPRAVFQPFALLLWNTVAGSRVHQLFAKEEQFVGPVPAVMFEAEVSYSYFLTLLNVRLDRVETVDHRSIGKFFRFNLPAITGSDRIQLDIEGGYGRGALLGRTPTLSLPPPEPGVFSPPPEAA